MHPKCHSIGGGVYVDQAGAFWARPWVNHRRTWRKLKAVKQREAFREAATSPWEAKAGSFADLARVYLDSGCPNKRLEPRLDTFTQSESARVAVLSDYFGPMPCSEITLATLPAYKVWRTKPGRLRQGTGERTVDKDLCTLSNVLSYGVATGQIPANLIRSGRPKYRRGADVRHAREVAPATADVIHQLAEFLFDSTVRTEPLAWQLLFGYLTGCRTSELLRLRVDATTPEQAGFYARSTLHAPAYLFLGRRSKGGVNPWSMVGPEFAQALECFQYWHRKRFPKSPWYFPSPMDPRQPLNPGALGHALTRAGADLKLPPITPHGLRSFYVTKRRSDGATDTVIAGEIGDQTVALMQTTYGARPANWTGGAALSWLPAQGLPAWQRWQPAVNKIITLSVKA